MRVAVVMEQCLSRVPGGTGRYSTEIARALAGRGGLEVTGWVAWHRRISAAVVTGATGPRRLPLPRRALIAAWERGLGPSLDVRADVVHAPTLLAPPRRRAPVVVTLHDAVPWTHPETLTPRGVRWHRTMAERAARFADAVVVPTEAVAAALHQHLRPRRLEVVGEGVADAVVRVPADAADRARRLGLPTGGYLLSLATVEPRKGLDVLLAAMAENSAPDLPLLVVGQPGWGSIDPLRLAADLGLPPGRVRLMGRLSDPDLAVVLREAAVLVVPSRAEGFGLPVIEGMAAGVPVVTSEDPALAEIGGPATHRAPVGNAPALARTLGDVITDPALRAGMVEQGLRRAARFTWDRVAVQLDDLYRDLCR